MGSCLGIVSPECACVLKTEVCVQMNGLDHVKNVLDAGDVKF